MEGHGLQTNILMGILNASKKKLSQAGLLRMLNGGRVERKCPQSIRVSKYP